MGLAGQRPPPQVLVEPLPPPGIVGAPLPQGSPAMRMPTLREGAFGLVRSLIRKRPN